MKLTTRTTHAFIEIKVDGIETTVFKSSPQEIQSMIENLLDVVNDLASYTDKSVKDYVEEGGLSIAHNGTQVGKCNFTDFKN